MRLILLAATLTAFPALAKPRADLAGPVRTVIETFIAGFNDPALLPAAKATHIATPTIIDEPAPYFWTGKDAMDSWLADQHKEAVARGRSEEKLELGRTMRAEMSGTHAYVMVQAVYTYKENGVPKVEPARMTFALHKLASDWKIAGWAWTGPRGKPVEESAAATAATGKPAS